MRDAVLGGRYALGAVIGQGGFARVHAATDLKLGRTVAVKCLAPGIAPDDEPSQRLTREARIMGVLDHANVCAALDAGTDAHGRPFLVLERLVGETLAARIAREGALPAALGSDVAVQLLDGLACAHARQVVHRDVTPRNVFLVPLGAGRSLVKLLDFGAARSPELANPSAVPLTRTGHVLGTPAYLSPEQARGASAVDARSDVYSAAVVLYEALAGATPFGHLGGAELLDAIAFRKPPSLAARAPHVDAAVASVIDAALSVSPADRPFDAARFRDRLLGRSPESSWDLATHQGPPPSRAPRD